MGEPHIAALYIANMIASGAALVVFGYYMKIQKERLDILPKSIRLYILTSPFAYSVITAVFSVYFSVHYLLYQDETTFIFKALRFTVAIAGQQVRGSVILLVIERIISTIFLERYSRFTSGYSVFVVLTILTYFYTALYTCPSIIWIFIPGLQFFYFVLLYLNIVLHGVTAIISHALHRRNQSMYRLLAYKVSLRRRYQILENIKVLSFLWPTFILFATVAPIGTVATVFYAEIMKTPAPTCLFLITYNFTFALVLLDRIRRHRKLNEVTPIGPSDRGVIEAPLGRSLPKTVSSDTYFKDLKQQWA